MQQTPFIWSNISSTKLSSLGRGDKCNQKRFLTRLLNILLNPLNLKWKVVKDSKGILYPKPLRLLNGHSNFLFGGITPKMFQTTTSRNRHVQRIRGGVAFGLNVTPQNDLQKWRWICFALPHPWLPPEKNRTFFF